MKTSETRGIFVKKLRTEYLENPLGIDVRKPSLSWQITSDARNVTQKAYQVQAACSVADLEAGKFLWDSGKVAPGDTTSIRYDGPALQSAQRIYWRVKTWDRDVIPLSMLYRKS